MTNRAGTASPVMFLTALMLGLSLSNNTWAVMPSDSADLLIRNARIIDGIGREIDGGSLAISGGRITAVIPGSTRLHAAVEIDASGLTVMPGLIDTHRHLLIKRGLDSDAAFDHWRDQHLSATLRSYLESGITTVMSAGDYQTAILEIKRSLAAGALTGPRLVALSFAFTAPGGHPAVTICKNNPWCQQHVAIQINDPPAARAKVRELASTGIDGFKLIYDGRLGAKLADAVFAAIADEAHQHKLPVFVHVPTADVMLRAVDLGADRLVHPPFFGTLAGTSAAHTMRVASVLVATTVGRGLGIEDTDRPQALANLRLLWDEGVPIAFGTDTPFAPAEALARETQLLSQVFSPAEIISALTHNAALFLGLDKEIGTLEAGKAADILILASDPLSDITALADVVMVIQSGTIVVDRR